MKRNCGRPWGQLHRITQIQSSGILYPELQIIPGLGDVVHNKLNASLSKLRTMLVSIFCANVIYHTNIHYIPFNLLLPNSSFVRDLREFSYLGSIYLLGGVGDVLCIIIYPIDLRCVVQ